MGCHPDYGTPGIEASTGSLGHGMGIAVGMAHANVINKNDSKHRIISYGHRNPQGLAKDDNFIIECEHGPTGGDELKIINLASKNDLNYGWPISSYWIMAPARSLPARRMTNAILISAANMICQSQTRFLHSMMIRP